MSTNYPLSTRVSNALKNIDQLSLELIDRIKNPQLKETFGWAKFRHMRRLSECPPISDFKIQSSPRLKQLLKVVLRAHDLGRHIEAIDELDTLRDGPRHGFLSARVLEESGILDSFDIGDRRDILDAITYHSEREVNLKVDSDAYTLCYALRDLDKEDIILDDKYLKPAGVLEQLRTHVFRHHFSEAELLKLRTPYFEGYALRRAQEVLDGSSVRRMTYLPGIPLQLSQKFEQILSGEVSPDALNSLLARKQVDLRLARENLAT
ncbi:MAG: hypothetical protein KDD53_05285, partial [Bdellovibrionales bacterium]|nr:hypothetical protein [Bdellovibrionales bacterium]